MDTAQLFANINGAIYDFIRELRVNAIEPLGEMAQQMNDPAKRDEAIWAAVYAARAGLPNSPLNQGPGDWERYADQAVQTLRQKRAAGLFDARAGQ